MVRTSWLWSAFCGAILSFGLPTSAEASCTQEFGCPEIPPCYRVSPEELCNPQCNCHSPDWPFCDPECEPGEMCDPDPTCPEAPPPPTCANSEFDACVPPGGGRPTVPPASGDCTDSLGRDICSVPPLACPPGEAYEVEYSGPEELIVINDRQIQHCGNIRVAVTGYYKLYDHVVVAESCLRQRDETAFLTITNSCTTSGLPLAGNARDGQFVVEDADNTRECSGDAECGDGMECSVGRHSGVCCVPTEPTYLGTFYIVAGEDNRVCLNHWCPLWEADNSLGHVGAGCSSIDSVHVIPEGLFACADAGAERVECGDPPAGPVDEDGDGFAEPADCDDDAAYVSPAAPEVCGDGIDNNCDGEVDPPGLCASSRPDAGPGTDAGSDGGTDAGSDDAGRRDPVDFGDGGCGCRVVSQDPAGVLPWLLAFALWIRRRRHNIKDS